MVAGGVSARTVGAMLTVLASALDDAMAQGLMARKRRPDGQAPQGHRHRDGHVDARQAAAQCAAAGVPVIRLHDVRHTTDMVLLDGSTTPSATAKWLGHDPAITLRVYGHVYDDVLTSASDALLGRSRAKGDSRSSPCRSEPLTLLTQRGSLRAYSTTVSL